jgi:hypothetical protein
MKQYTLITGTVESDIIQRVNDALVDGWKLVGPISIACDHRGHVKYAQTLGRVDESRQESRQSVGKEQERLDEPHFEIISPLIGNKVVGVCRDPNDADDKGDDVYGLITKQQFDAYNDESKRHWEKPKSKRRFRLVPQPKKLEEI